MSGILRKYFDGEYSIIEYTQDGVTISSIIKEPIPVEQGPAPEPEIIPTLEEKVDTIQAQIQSDNLVTFEVLASMYEESSLNNMTSFEVMATMYEEILELRTKVDQLNGGITP